MEECPVCGQKHVWIHKKISFLPISIVESKPFPNSKYDKEFRVTQCQDGLFTFYVHPKRDRYYRTQPVLEMSERDYSAEDIQRIVEQ